jgi:hypothetical protein
MKNNWERGLKPHPKVVSQYWQVALMAIPTIYTARVCNKFYNF